MSQRDKDKFKGFDVICEAVSDYHPLFHGI